MIVNNQLDITGEDLAFAASTFDEQGGPAVAFTLTDQGSGRFFALTTNNAPIGSRQRQLGIILDDNLLSAPNINSPIRKDGRITGNFTRAEVDHLVQILKAGQLPAALTKKPIAENQIDATLGADTIRKGVWAIGTSLILVLLFILYLLPVCRPDCLPRAGRQPGDDLGHDGVDQSTADAARFGRFGVDGRYVGRRQCADLRADSRGIEEGCCDADGDSQRIFQGDGHDHRRQSDDVDHRDRVVCDRHRPDSRICGHVDLGHLVFDVHGDLCLAEHCSISPNATALFHLACQTA